MRIWHEQLIPKLCQKHLCAMWREGLGAYKIITENKKGYRNHPAVKEFEDCPDELFKRLQAIRKEMIRRGYKPKEIEEKLIIKGIMTGNIYIPNKPKPWQTLKQQIEVLKSKNCKCKID